MFGKKKKNFRPNSNILKEIEEFKDLLKDSRLSKEETAVLIMDGLVRNIATSDLSEIQEEAMLRVAFAVFKLLLPLFIPNPEDLFPYIKSKYEALDETFNSCLKDE